MRPTRQLWLWALILGLTAVLAWPVYIVVHDLSARPAMLAVYRGVGGLFQAIPQAALWLVLVLTLYLMAGLKWLEPIGHWWFDRWQPRGEGLPDASGHGGRVATLARWLKRQHSGPFSRHFVQNALSELAVEMLAHEYRVSTAQIRARLAEQALELPPEISAYLAAGLELWPAEPSGWWRAWPSRLGLVRPATPGAMEADMEHVLKFLEDRGESLR